MPLKFIKRLSPQLSNHLLVSTSRLHFKAFNYLNNRIYLMEFVNGKRFQALDFHLEELISQRHRSVIDVNVDVEKRKYRSLFMSALYYLFRFTNVPCLFDTYFDFMSTTNILISLLPMQLHRKQAPVWSMHALDSFVSSISGSKLLRSLSIRPAADTSALENPDDSVSVTLANNMILVLEKSF